MKTLASLLLLSLAFTALPRPARAQNLPDILAQNFFSPELVRMAQPALNLTDEQKSALQDAVQAIEPRLAETRTRLEKENGLLLDLVKPQKLEPDAVMVQADKVMRLELDLQRANLALALKIRETLAPEQQATLREFKAKTTGFQARVGQAMELAQQWKADGRDLSAFEQARQQFESLMGAGKFQAAEALLDQTIQRLKAPPSAPKK